MKLMPAVPPLPGAPPPPSATRSRGSRFQQALKVVSWVGLGLSTLTFVIGLPSLIRTGGAANVLTNVLELGWTVLVLVVCAALTRTIGPKAIAGAFFAGFFGTTALALLAGRPAIERFGADSPFAVAVWAPATEELLKLLPVATFLLFALLNRRARPAIADAVLFGATVAAGFALRENAAYGRGTNGGWLAHLPFSVLLPSVSTVSGGGQTMVVGGHVVYTALNALALGVTIVYWRRYPLARLAAPIAVAETIVEHMTVNRISITGDDQIPLWTKVAQVLSLGGYLSSILLVAGLIAVTLIEWRLVRTASTGGQFRTLLRPGRAEIGRRMLRYAAERVPPRQHSPTGTQGSHIAGAGVVVQESR